MTDERPGGPWTRHGPVCGGRHVIQQALDYMLPPGQRLRLLAWSCAATIVAAITQALGGCT